MDSETVKVLLNSHEQAFRTSMNIVTEQLSARIKSLENTVAELTRSLEFTQAEAVDLKSYIKELKKTNSEQSKIIGNYEVKVNELEHKVNYQEDYNRRKNLRFSGVQEPTNETWEQTAKRVTEILEEKLDLTSVQIDRAHRVGPRTTTRPRVIVVRFDKYADRETVLRNARKLKGSGIFINEDLCPASQEKKNQQLPTLQRARLEGKIAYFRHTKLVIKEREGYQHDNQGPRSVSPGEGHVSRAGSSHESARERTTSPGLVGRASRTWTDGSLGRSSLVGAVGGELSTPLGEDEAGGHKQTGTAVTPGPPRRQQGSRKAKK